MNWVISGFHKLHNLGVKEEDSETEIRSRRILNRQNLVAFSLHFLFIPFFIYLEFWLIVGILSVGFAFVLLSMYLSSKGQNREALLIDILYFAPAITLCAHFIKGGNGIEYISMALISLPLYCVNSVRKVFIIGLYLLIILCLLAYPILDIHSYGIYEVPNSFKLAFQVACMVSFFGYILNQLVLFMDINLKMQEEVNEQREKLIMTSRLSDLGLMAAGVAHEVNNPLMIIQGNAQKIQRKSKAADAENEKALGKILNACSRIVQITMGLKKFARDGVQDDFEEVDLYQVINEIYVLMEEKLNHKKFKVEFISEKNLPPLMGKPVQLGQVILTLFTNSFEAIQDKEDKWIRLEFVKEEKSLKLLFSDSGDGIPEENLSKIMNPFFTTKPIGQGTGLGLSIAKGILDDHNALFEVDSKAPNTCFIITFPLSQESRLAV